MILVQLIDLYSLIVLAAVIVSWFQLPPTHPVRILLDAMTEPLLALIRRVLPPTNGFDFSALVLLVALRMLRGVVLSAVFGL